MAVEIIIKFQGKVSKLSEGNFSQAWVCILIYQNLVTDFSSREDSNNLIEFERKTELLSTPEIYYHHSHTYWKNNQIQKISGAVSKDKFSERNKFQNDAVYELFSMDRLNADLK